MINLHQALLKLKELEQRDGTSGFIHHIFKWTVVGEYYLDEEFGFEFKGGGDKGSHYPHPETDVEYDLQYVQMAYAIAKRAIGGPLGRIVAAGYMIGWIDFCIAVTTLQGELGGMHEFSTAGPNYKGWCLGMEASHYSSFSEFVDSYVSKRQTM